MRTRSTGLFWVLVAVSCGREQVNRKTVVCPQVEQGAEGPLQPGDSVQFLATTFQTCREANVEVSCEVALVQDVLAVSVSRSWRVRPVVGPCRSLVGDEVSATCASPPLDEGSYAVRYARETQAFEVPGELPGRCLSPPDAQ